MSNTGDRPIRARNALIGVVIVGVAAALVWFWTRGRQPVEVEVPAVESVAVEVVPDAEPPATDDSTQPSRRPADAIRNWAEVTGEPPRWPDDLAAPRQCDAVAEELGRICAALDVRAPALREYGGACALLERLGSELAASPPDLSSELKSYDTLLENVFHLFRVVGVRRMAAIRRALAEEEVAEPAAMALYRWAVSREKCSGSRAPAVRRAALYSYAGFLFNTLGGQAYLRRRSPRVEALACFYGLQALDGAIRSGHNPDGLDPRPEIPRCRELVASPHLVFSDRYVAELDAMAQRWESRPPVR